MSGEPKPKFSQHRGSMRDFPTTQMTSAPNRAQGPDPARLSEEEVAEMEKNLAALVGDRDPATIYFETRADWYSALLSERAASSQRVAKLRAALERYGEHDLDCGLVGDDGASTDCTCGFYATREALAEDEKL